MARTKKKASGKRRSTPTLNRIIPRRGRRPSAETEEEEEEEEEMDEDEMALRQALSELHGRMQDYEPQGELASLIAEANAIVDDHDDLSLVFSFEAAGDGSFIPRMRVRGLGKGRQY